MPELATKNTTGEAEPAAAAASSPAGTGALATATAVAGTAGAAKDLWEPRPYRSPEAGLPDCVTVFEVGPRDGLQAEPVVVPTELKAELATRLWAAGLSSVEVTSFVPPKWIPQLSDAAELSELLDIPGRADARSADSASTATAGTEPGSAATGSTETECAAPGEGANGAPGLGPAVALVPNVKGLNRAVAAGYRSVAAVACATESFAKANLNTTVDGALTRVEEIVAAASTTPEGTVPVRGYLSMSFGDPWEGHVDPGHVAELAARLYRAGCHQVALGDTIGTATPGHVKEVLRAVVGAGVPTEALALHMHDTYAMALANVYAGLGEGVRVFDSAAGGLGRCPYAPGAAGNLATEDLVWMLEGLGAATGIDLDAVIETSLWFGERIGRDAPSRVVRAAKARRTA